VTDLEIRAAVRDAVRIVHLVLRRDEQRTEHTESDVEIRRARAERGPVNADGGTDAGREPARGVRTGGADVDLERHHEPRTGPLAVARAIGDAGAGVVVVTGSGVGAVLANDGLGGGGGRQRCDEEQAS
jgi:hypothetical protein